MISEKDWAIIIKLADEYELDSVILFGSTLTRENPNDIDLGIKGIHPEKFFDFCWQLYKHLSLPVDIIDLDIKSALNDLVERDGVVLYGWYFWKSTRRNGEYLQNSFRNGFITNLCMFLHFFVLDFKVLWVEKAAGAAWQNWSFAPLLEQIISGN